MTTTKTTPKPTAVSSSNRDLTAEIGFLTRALKAPTMRDAVARLAESSFDQLSENNLANMHDLLDKLVAKPDKSVAWRCGARPVAWCRNWKP